MAKIMLIQELRTLKMLNKMIGVF